MRNRILGGVGILWGGGILVHSFNKGDTGNKAYDSGTTVAMIFGAVLVLVGLYYLMKGDDPR